MQYFGYIVGLGNVEKGCGIFSEEYKTKMTNEKLDAVLPLLLAAKDDESNYFMIGLSKVLVLDSCFQNSTRWLKSTWNITVDSMFHDQKKYVKEILQNNGFEFDFSKGGLYEQASSIKWGSIANGKKAVGKANKNDEEEEDEAEGDLFDSSYEKAADY